MGWDTACPDWVERLKSGRSLVPDFPLFRDEEARALAVFGRFRLPDVIGTPTLKDAMAPWFFPIVSALFGSYDSESHKRWIKEVFILVPKKNAKTTGAAGLMMTAIILNRRPNAEFLLIAPTKEIASISYRQMRGMIKIDPDLDALFSVRDHIKQITHRNSGATIRVLAADTATVTGSKPTGVLIDETHVFGTAPRARDVFAEIRGAFAARPDGFLVQLTTQSPTPPAGVFSDELRRARGVRDGEIQASLLPVLYELPEDLRGDWQNPDLFKLVNPSLGWSVDPEFLTGQLASAKISGSEQLALFASKHLNIEIGINLQDGRWAGADYWASQSRELTLADLISWSEVITIGIDGGGLDDLLGLSVVGREAGTGQWLTWSHVWAHPQALERRLSEVPKYQDFAQDGDMTLVGQIGDDIECVKEYIVEIEASGKLDRIGVDQAGIGAIVDALQAAGIDEDRIVGIPQGWKLVGSIKTTERKLAEETLVHGGSRMMAWQVGNARIEPMGNAIAITKQVSGSAKIDALMALFNAVALMSLNPKPPAKSHWEYD